MDEAPPERYPAVKFKYTAATRSTGTEGSEGGTHGSFIYLRISIHEEKHFAARRACACIAHGGDFAMLDSKGAGSHLLCNLWSRIRGGIVHHNHLVRLGEFFHGRADAAQALANPTLFIMCRDDEGDHSVTGRFIFDPFPSSSAGSPRKPGISRV